MADFPNSIFAPRTVENLPDISYDAGDKKTGFAEDYSLPAAEIKAIEEILGTNPEGDKNTVKERIAALEVQKPAFTARKTSGNQTGIASATFTKAQMNSEIFDYGSHYNTTLYRWTPPAGVVAIILSAYILSGNFTAGGNNAVVLYKNGEIHRAANLFEPIANNEIYIQGTFLDIANGTDYYEMYVYGTLTSGTFSMAGDSINTYFSGFLI